MNGWKNGREIVAEAAIILGHAEETAQCLSIFPSWTQELHEFLRRPGVPVPVQFVALDK